MTTAWQHQRHQDLWLAANTVALTEPWADLPAGRAMHRIEQCADGTSLVRTLGAEPVEAWVPSHLLTAHRPPDPYADLVGWTKR